MKKRLLFTLAGLILSLLVSDTPAAAPRVTYVTALQRANTKLVDIWYGLADADGDSARISLSAGVNGTNIAATSLSGDIGTVIPSNSLHIVWDADADWNNNSNLVSFTISADNSLPPAAISNMVVVPAGVNNGLDPSYGAFSLTNKKAFYMDKFEITNDQMVDLMQWAYRQGKITVTAKTVQNNEGEPQELLDLDDIQCRITWDGTNFGMRATYASGYPCIEVTWYGAVAFCNYRSERYGLTPCYDLSDWSVNTNANGFRLPFSAEREYAARGGSAWRFPWGNEINHDYANYVANGNTYYDTSPYTNNTYDPDYYDGNPNVGLALGTSPVNAFELGKNGYGLYDMAGNVWEWCYEWYPGYSPAEVGTNGVPQRIRRGGSWRDIAAACRCGNFYRLDPPHSGHHVGFRTLITAGVTNSMTSAPAAVNTTGASRIITLSGNLAFGTNHIGRTRTLSFTITNSGDAPLNIISPAYPAGFSGYWAGTIPPGGTQTVAVTFKPEVQTNYTGTLTVYSDATSGNTTLPLSGYGKLVAVNDYDGDGGSDMTVFQPATARWYALSISNATPLAGTNWGWTGAETVTGDFDGDGISDLAVFDRNTGHWFIRQASGPIIAWNLYWGWPGAQPVPGDFDGDGIDDLAVFDQNTGNWFIRKVSGPIIGWNLNWGWPGAQPVPGDFDGDGIDDLAVFDRNTGNWFIRKVSGPIIGWYLNWGWPGAQPIPGDFNGDNKSDLAVFDRNTGNWFIREVSGPILGWNTNWGWRGATALSGDYDADGIDDLAIYDDITGKWYIRKLSGPIISFGTVWRNDGSTPVIYH